MQAKRNNIYVIGHKNPDTDSICSAIAYAELKNQLRQGDEQYIASRAGQINEETQYVLSYFGQKAPRYFSDVRPQVRDVEIREVEGVSENMSLNKAWEMMRSNGLVTLPIVKNQKLEGVITVGDIAYSDMDVYDNTIVAKAKTQYSNLIETLHGEMLVGNEQDYFDKGKILIATANPDVLEQYIDPHDLIILGNRYESQLCAIEMGAGCLVISAGAVVSRTICKLAEEKGCTIISTPFDTYTVARLINHSIPISYFMTRDNIVTFSSHDLVEDIRKVMAKIRVRDFPILDSKNRYIGMISRRNLLNLAKKRLILVDHNESSQAVDGYEHADILEIIDHHRIGNLETMAPAFFRNQPVGCTATIVYQMYMENQVPIPQTIAGLLCAAIISDTLLFRSPTATAIDRAAAEHLARIANLDLTDFATQMFAAGSNLHDKSAEEIFYQDYKKFVAGDVTFGVGQINSMDASELSMLKERLLPYMHKAIREHGVDMLFFMLTNIMEETTELLCIGEGAAKTAADAFGQPVEAEHVYLKGVVSRKKQMIPVIMASLQQ
ncbi:MAG: putative manganese-dependent inorganic diphosphatase [Lachnospiraceae bacterium]